MKFLALISMAAAALAVPIAPGGNQDIQVGTARRALSDLTKGVQGGEVVRRYAEPAPAPADSPLGAGGIPGGSMLDALPLDSVTGILRRWLGF
ncbi:hypothetical protein DOTSEDRAFT_75042 [Dothistroma septosporum NZE10]|uniref:Uncharacterized protein n=1 Tax=Dothistroma septosporum (strain NZE10 / CBS 128990) TaxID=675120 RepID=M2WJL5_DOTSN|nr:hypothetical protein DOTSEDRAFT_75042 [Dothistroma septosporum NZE10]